MNDRKLQIMQAAIKLFGDRDYHTTSVQDIVSLAGVSKGAFYLHFHSKEELLIAIFRHYMDGLSNHLNEIQTNCQYTPRDKLIKAIEFQCQYIMSDQDFLSLHLKGIAFMNNTVKEMMIEHGMQTVKWKEERILEHYGPGIEAHSFDCASMLSGMLKEYFFYHIVYAHPIDINRFSEYLMNRLDDIAQGIMAKPTAPILYAALMCPDPAPAFTKETWLQKAHSVRDWIEAHQTDPSKSAEAMLQSLDAIIQEVHKEQPNEIIIKGMYNYLVSLANGDPSIIEKLTILFSDIR
ncbi:TetR family transcriptional regulator [Paenibacillus sp. LMG 31456]|uniref:TetR family transcriptional regulator n=1 Tax=Paenibacillus foliorum TaxID=2654974 RepID=A0A972GXQ6_9BACL|nr:TetR/AcrR family transcriptional regulator [Paenibacillus foliorum]NOU94815.1 TetR family transcriptional regulator [Paenibacillus foliorum]